jgi:hypothetical protein
MELKLDEYKLNKINLSVPEVLMLKSLDDSASNNYNLSDIFESLQREGYISGFANDNITFTSITNIGQMILDRIVEEQVPDQEEQSEEDQRLERIAKAMIEIYPKGFKKDDLGQDAYPWRSSVNAIKDRLHKFEEKYYQGKKLDINDAVETTRRYVESNRKRDPLLLRTMRTLKYFIYKDNESTFLEWLETEEGEDAYDETNGMTIL